VDFPENAQYLPLLSNLLKKNLTLFHDCPFMALPKTYETFLNGLSRNQRKNLYRTGRRLKETFEVEFVDYSKLESFPDGMSFLFDLHQKRWESRGLPGIFADQKVRDFNLDVSKKLFERKWLSLFLLRLSGKPVSATYGFKYRSKFCEYVTGFEPSYNKYNVGNLLRAHMVNQFIEEGLNEFDFMRGAEEYKERWNTTIRWNRRAILTRKGFPSAFRNWLYNEYSYQIRKAKRLLKTR
jgi:CelD/BcsL family acetyltransferase involved in cellulose biosynthesis